MGRLIGGTNNTPFAPHIINSSLVVPTVIPMGAAAAGGGLVPVLNPRLTNNYNAAAAASSIFIHRGKLHNTKARRMMQRRPRSLIREPVALATRVECQVTPLSIHALLRARLKLYLQQKPQYFSGKKMKNEKLPWSTYTWGSFSR